MFIIMNDKMFEYPVTPDYCDRLSKTPGGDTINSNYTQWSKSSLGHKPFGDLM